jgi:ABC-2 type transport system permease protein
MFTLFKREVNYFFSSLIGYIVISVFLIMMGLLLWVFSGQFNILDTGYANIDSLFILAPWVFLFLIPAITMRVFAEEKRTGTIELLLTRPLSDFTIVFAKFLASLFIVFLAMLPTIIYFITIYLLAVPQGNIDVAGITGSFIGLFFLAAVYVSIGIFASSLTENQIIAFIIALLISFFFFTGFDSLALLNFLSPTAPLIQSLGISAHYTSISRGVIDSRDIIYFLSVIALFLFFTRLKLQSRKWK